MALLAMEIQMGVLYSGFIHLRSSRTMWCLTHVYVHAQNAVCTHLMNYSYFEVDSELEPHAGIKMCRSWIYICGLSSSEIKLKGIAIVFIHIQSLIFKN